MAARELDARVAALESEVARLKQRLDIGNLLTAQADSARHSFEARGVTSGQH